MNLHEPHRRTVHLSCYGNQHGTVFVLVAFLLTVLIGVAALAVDIGYVAITRNQLQNAQMLRHWQEPESSARSMMPRHHPSP